MIEGSIPSTRIYFVASAMSKVEEIGILGTSGEKNIVAQLIFLTPVHIGLRDGAICAILDPLWMKTLATASSVARNAP